MTLEPWEVGCVVESCIPYRDGYAVVVRQIGFDSIFMVYSKTEPQIGMRLALLRDD